MEFNMKTKMHFVGTVIITIIFWWFLNGNSLGAGANDGELGVDVIDAVSQAYVARNNAYLGNQLIMKTAIYISILAIIWSHALFYIPSTSKCDSDKK
jgi:hypothetical protein